MHRPSDEKLIQLQQLATQTNLWFLRSLADVGELQVGQD